LKASGVAALLCALGAVLTGAVGLAAFHRADFRVFMLAWMNSGLSGQSLFATVNPQLSITSCALSAAPLPDVGRIRIRMQDCEHAAQTG
jgi:hypothetical protein